MHRSLQQFRDEEMMMVASFMGALLYMCSEQYGSACSLVLGYVAGQTAYFAFGQGETVISKQELLTDADAPVAEQDSYDRAA